MKVVLDSSAWVEWVLDSPAAAQYAPAFKDLSDLVVPTICISEVCRYVHRNLGPEGTETVGASMQQGTVLPLSAELAVNAARLGQTYGLALADSLVYASARHENAQLWTQDADFKDLPGVRYFPKKKA